MKRKLIAPVFAAALLLTMAGNTVFASEADSTAKLESRIAALEARVSELETLLGASEASDSGSTTDTTSKAIVLNPGVYVVGEDIQPGTYDFTVLDGTGNIAIYKSYEDYASGDYFSYLTNYFLCESNTLAHHRDSEHSAYDSYASKAHIRLDDGMCMCIESLNLEGITN